MPTQLGIWRVNPSVAPLGPGAKVLVAQNHLVSLAWTPPVTQTSASISLTATGQTTITQSVSGSSTSALIDGVAAVDTSGNPITWSATVTINGTDALPPVSFTPAFVKPNTSNTGIPSGTAGDIRPPITQTTVTASEMQDTIGSGPDGATYSNFNITGGAIGIYANNCIFIGCTFTGEVVMNTGSGPKSATFIDCLFEGGLDYAVQLTGAFYEFRRCDIHGGADVLDPSAVATQEDLVLRHCYLHDVAYISGAHSDTYQLSTAGADIPGWYGWLIGCFLEATEGDGGNNMNSYIQIDGDPTRMQAIFDHCWFDAPNVPYYPFHGGLPTHNSPGDITFRNGFVGLNVGTVTLFYPGFTTNLGWTNMVWETTGPLSNGAGYVTAGTPVPLTA